MPNIQHAAITEAYLHESKGVSTAAANKVYVTDGAASGAWQKITKSQIDSTVLGTVQAFGNVISGALQSGSLNVASVVDGGTFHTVTFTTAMANTTYVVMLTYDHSAISDATFFLNYDTRTTTSFKVYGGVSLDPISYSFVVFNNA